MKAPCDLARDFVSGELVVDEQRRFFDHLSTCARCLRASPDRRGRRWQALALALGAAGAAFAAVVALGLAVIPAAPATRSLEARVGPPEQDVFAPYAPPGGGESRRAALSYQELSALEARDRRALVARLLQAGAVGAARAQLDGPAAGAGLDNERAVLALLEDRPDEALVLLDRLVAVEPRSGQSLWNRALAASALGLPHAAVADFSTVAALGEPGWAAEAGARAAALMRGLRRGRPAARSPGRPAGRPVPTPASTGWRPAP